MLVLAERCLEESLFYVLADNASLSKANSLISNVGACAA